MQHTKRIILVATLLVLAIIVRPRAYGIDITLDYTLDTRNNNWFGGTSEGLARRAALDSAAGFLSAIITNDDWSSLGSLNETFSLSDIAAGSINDIDGNPLPGQSESDGEGYRYDIVTTNRSSVAENEYIIYVGAFAFDSGTSAHAKGGWDSNDRRNAAGFALTEFNTWGGRIYFDSSNDWYAGQNPGIDPVDDYGWQDPNKMPSSDISSDNWDWSTSSDTWKGFDLESIDTAADGKLDLYATAMHEMMHALGATSSNMSTYVGVSGDDLIGENLVAEFGGPVPSDGGHFATNLQSEVWDSSGIISEALLDPNSLRSVRKYFTKIDAALLRDLGYQVLSEFVSADFDSDGDVDGDDLAQWQIDYSANGNSDADGDGDSDGVDLLAWQRQFGSGLGAVATSATVPEPDSAALLLALAVAGFLCRSEGIGNPATELRV